MNDTGEFDTWDVGSAYESYVGRWSGIVADEFLAWLRLPAMSRWLDVGCGTGALSRAVLRATSPDAVLGIDPSAGFVRYARHSVDSGIDFCAGDALFLPHKTATFDAVVSGLVINFVPDPEKALSEMARVARPGGTVGLYVWDYAGRMDMIRYFWDAATSLDPAAESLDEGRRFPLCNPEALRSLLVGAGLHDLETRAIDVPAHFASFDDYWTPFLGGQGPAPGYIASLDDAGQTALQDQLHATLPFDADGSLNLIARAWAIRCTT